MEEVLYCYDGSFDGFLCCVFESYASRERPAAIVREEMEGAVKLAVEMKADVHQGKTWYDAKG